MTIKVEYDVFSSRFHIDKALNILSTYDLLSFDTETKGLYTKAERKEAVQLLKNENLPVDTKRIAMMVAKNSGLSFPSLLSVTHFVFGTREDHSVILICEDSRLEIHIWRWIARQKSIKFLIHNTLFDLKIMYNRILDLPGNYEDTAILAKCLMNNADVWKSKVGLKDLMGEYYDPTWSLFEDYEPDNLKEVKFLKYAAIDGGSTFKLWVDIQMHLLGDTWSAPEERDFKV